MAGRLPFNLPNHTGSNPLHDPQIRAALGLSQVDEALFLQQQRELQRDFHLRQLLLQDQLGQQSRLDSLVVEQKLKQLREQLQEFPELQQHYTQILLQDRLQQEEFARAQLQKHEELQRRALAQSQAQAQAQQHPPVQQGHKKPHPQNSHPGQQNPPAQAQQPSSQSLEMSPRSHPLLRDLAADSLAGNAVKRGELEKRIFAKPDEGVAALPTTKKRPRLGTEDSGEGKTKKKKDKPATSKKNSDASNALVELGKAASQAVKQPSVAKLPGKGATAKSSTLKPSAQALLDFASGGSRSTAPTVSSVMPLHGTLGDILNAAEASQIADDAACALTEIKAKAEWSDDDEDEGLDAEQGRAAKQGDMIELPNFYSVLPQLPQEPEALTPPGSPERKWKKRYKSLLDDDSVDEKVVVKAKVEKKEVKEAPGQPKPADPAVADLPYPVDTWWPKTADVRKERKAAGGAQEEDVQEDDDEVLGPETPFRANMSEIKEKFAHEVTPGVLEKVPHCRIHRLSMKKRKFMPVPELVHCFQVTELYPNDMILCCSHCGSWRHSACGGHYKPYSVRECIEAPFTAVCDRCHAEEKILRDTPTARKRIDRQRSEQIRRALATSAAMRQASFSKHGGTYKWPLGSVSATHIGGHTRSVHHRHDKAEKQWADMASRLNKSHNHRPKERVKIRTKELERLLVSVEDAEGHTERHNMMLFLLNDTLRENPIGFEKRRRNIFDPEEDEVSSEALEGPAALANGSHHSAAPSSAGNKSETSVSGTEGDSTTVESSQYADSNALPDSDVCARKDCYNKPRFDSVFCSDACGVHSLESDLLRTFHYTSDMHPSLLRS